MGSRGHSSMVECPVPTGRREFDPHLATPFEFAAIPFALAKPFIDEWHYSHKCPRGKNIFYGAFVDHDLYAVAAYGIGVNMDKGRSLAALTGLPVNATNLFELKRLCRRGEKGASKIALTRFISLCHQSLRTTGVRFIVSYSDPTEAHTAKPGEFASMWTAEDYSCGYIYKAASFTHLGKTNLERHFVDRDGGFVHRRVPYKMMKRWNDARGLQSGGSGKRPKGAMNMPIAQRLMGLTASSDTLPKDRWFKDLGVWQDPKTRAKKPVTSPKDFSN